MAGTTRYLYNFATAMIRDKQIPFESLLEKEAKIMSRKSKHEASDKKGEYKETAYPWLNFQYMRNFLVNNETAFVKARPWMKETANSIRQVAVQEAISNHKAALTNLKAGNITHFSTPFRRKTTSWSLALDPTQLKYDKVLPASDFGRLRVSQPELLQERYTSQPRITRDRYNRYYLVLVDPIAVLANTKAVADRVVMSIDPGIRTRHAIFSTRNGGEVFDIGSGDVQKIVRMAKQVDKKISESTNQSCNHQQRRRLLKQRLKLTARIMDLKKEMDYQTIRFLEKSASCVLLPAFEVHGMASRLYHKTARQLMCWGHGLFKQRLLQRASRGTLEVMIVSEHYTSKTCGACGRLDNNLGSKKVFHEKKELHTILFAP